MCTVCTLCSIPHFSVEKRLHACGELAQTPSVPSFASESAERPVHHLVPLGCLAQSGLDAVPHGSQDTRDRSRRPTHSAGATYYREALYLSQPAGKYVNVTWKVVWHW